MFSKRPGILDLLLGQTLNSNILQLSLSLIRLFMTEDYRSFIHYHTHNVSWSLPHFYIYISFSPFFFPT